MSGRKPLYRNIHIWYHPKLPIKFVTYPLVSYGTSDFFNNVHAELNEFKTIFSDNIVWKKRKSGPVNLGFVFKDKAMPKPSNGKVIDSMKKNQVMQQSFMNFNNWKKRVKYLFQIMINRIIGNTFIKNYFRKRLYNKDYKRKKVDDFRPLFNLLFKEHIQSHICDEVLHYHNHFKSKQVSAKAAIVCDAQQMSLVFRLLKNLGYKWQLKRRLEAF
jgi:hypothetical protein